MPKDQTAIVFAMNASRNAKTQNFTHDGTQTEVIHSAVNIDMKQDCDRSEIILHQEP
jgi:hypothetical protein